jgi:phage baseplate assembly protein gpV
MKNLATLILSLFSVLSFGQFEAGEEILIDKAQTDDTYIAGENIRVNAVVQGDLVIAGANLIVNDSIQGDLTAAGGEISVEGYIDDDVRVAGGKITVDSEIGDDLVVFGGEVILTENALINGKLVCYGGDVTIDGEVVERLDVRGGEVTINGTIRGPSTLAGEDLMFGSNAKFHKDVEYWHSDGEINFNYALVDAKAQFNEDLEEESAASLIAFGITSFKNWLIYILSAFLAILVFHALFRNAFASAVEGLEDNLLKSFGFGLIYLIGIPVAILSTFFITIGIKLGLFAAAVFVFSLVFGQIVAAILITYYLRDKKDKDWGFWPVTFIALAFAILLRLLAMIPYAGIVLAIVILSVTYGALTLQVFRAKKQRIKN